MWTFFCRLNVAQKRRHWNMWRRELHGVPSWSMNSSLLACSWGYVLFYQTSVAFPNFHWARKWLISRPYTYTQISLVRCCFELNIHVCLTISPLQMPRLHSLYKSRHHWLMRWYRTHAHTYAYTCTHSHSHTSKYTCTHTHTHTHV